MLFIPSTFFLKEKRTHEFSDLGILLLTVKEANEEKCEAKIRM